MARNGSGTYSLPVNSWNPAVNGVSATAADWQALINDVATALTQSLSADGQTALTGNLVANNNKITGLAAGTATGDSLRFQQLFSQGQPTDIASAATTDIGAVNSTLLNVTGTTTITSFGANYNGPRFLRFDGVLTLTNGVSLVLPGAANITTAAGDSLIAVPTGSPASGWRVVGYFPAGGVVAKAGDTMTGNLNVPSLNGGQLAGFRNLLINGNFAINQRNYVSGAATSGANQYTLDRWRVVTSGQSVTFSTSGNGNQITAPAGGIEQVIEGANIGGGTYVLNWTGTASALVNGTPRTKGESFTLTANTDATVRFSSGTVSLAQLETGTVTTPFEYRPLPIELGMCRRYFFSHESGALGVGSFGIGYCRSTVSFLFAVPYKEKMRTAPALSFSGSVGDYSVSLSSGDVAVTSITMQNAGPDLAIVDFTVAAGLTAGAPGRSLASGGVRYLNFDAEI